MGMTTLQRLDACRRVLAWAKEHINANADEWSTGGNCTAIGIPCDDGGHWLVTCADGAESPESLDELVAVGRYGKSGDTWVCFEVANMAAAAALIASCKAAEL